MRIQIIKQIKLLMILPFLFLSSTLFSQGYNGQITIGFKSAIKSKVLNEERQIWIYTPPSYGMPDQKFPVMYLLDGDGHFHHTTGIIHFLLSQDLIPEMMVVGIPNMDRTRDLTPTMKNDTTQNFPTGGGADNFLKFISDELRPHIDKTYRTSPYNILVGHSFGGLFAIHALMNQPETFNAYLAISPSLWWDNGLMAKNATAAFADKQDIKAQLYMTLGNEGGAMLANVWRYAGALEEAAPETLKWKYFLMEEETHGSIPHRSTYDGLLFFFDNWQLPRPKELAKAGVLKAIDEHYARLSETYGYEITPQEGKINALGYQFLRANKTSGAIAIFERNIANFPESPNVYDSAGDGYDAAGDLKKALKSYKKAVEIGEVQNSTNLSVYQANVERIKKKIKEK